MKRTKPKYELILFFERFNFTPKVAFAKLQKLGYSRSTIYRYYNEWGECKNILKQLEKNI